MREIESHLRKDMAFLYRDSLFVLATLLALVLFVVFAFSCSGVYDKNVSGMTMTMEDMQNLQRSLLYQYWMSVMGIESLVVIFFSAFMIAIENETGTLGLTLTYGVKLWQVYLSKLLTLIILGMMLNIIALVTFIAIFSSVNALHVSLLELLSTAIFPTLFSITIASLGLLMSALLRKKNSAVVVSLITLMLLQALFSYGMAVGYNDAVRDLNENHIYGKNTNEDVLDHFSQEMKLLLLLNPYLVQEGLVHTTVSSQGTPEYASQQYFTLMSIWGDFAFALVVIVCLNIMALSVLSHRFKVRHVVYVDTM